MDHRTVGEYWENNAEAWTRLSRAGLDVYRDFLNTPGFLEMLPDIQGLIGVDIGCGEGSNTRRLSQRGAIMNGVDISGTFIRHARDLEAKKPLGIDYVMGSAVELPYSNERFDFATAFMSLMEFPELGLALSEAHRVLKPGGFLQFSIPHPCFDTPHRRNLRNLMGKTYAIEIGKYFEPLKGEISEWIFKQASPDQRRQFGKFRIPRFTRTLSQWLNQLIESGFVIEKVGEPRPSNEALVACPEVQDAQVVAYFLHLRVRKPLV